jgi:precorrin-2 dehydrogenase / sirohydrochlorin ferrochelatase
MLPVVLDLARLKVALVGDGEAALRRLRLLDEAGAGRELRVFAGDDPSPELWAAAGARLRRRWPTSASFADIDVAFLAGLPAEPAAAIADCARAARVIVNVEDTPELSDFHSPATVRRGDLVLTVSTGGRSPGLAGRLRRWLAEQFGAEWGERLDEIAARRAAWREAGAAPAEVARWTDQWLERHGWLPDPETRNSRSVFSTSINTNEEVSHGTAAR